MRILHAVRSDGFAGVERHVAELARAQAARGDDVLVIGGDPRAMRAALGGLGGPGDPGGPGGPGDGAVAHRPAATVLQVTRALVADGPGRDVVHVHMTAAEVAATLAAAAAPALRRVPVVATQHFAAPRGSGALGPLVAAVAGRRLAGEIAISDYVADRAALPGHARAAVVHPGVRQAPGTVAPAAGREQVVLAVQRLEAEKSTDVAVRAFAASGLAHEGWVLELAGDGAERASLERLAAELGLGGAVRFLGRRDDVPDLLARAAILVATCPIEGLGLAVLEGMAMGVPVVASAAGGHRETVGQVPGAPLFAPGVADEAGALLAALAADPARRDTLARAGLGVQGERFTPGAHAAGVAAVYERVLGRVRA